MCSLDVVGLELRLYGAELTNQMNENVTHIIFDKKYIYIHT